MAPSPFICVVDDADDYRFILQQVFKRFFPAYTVEFFSEGQALLDGLAQMSPKPGLILLDHHMPGLDGYQTLLRLKGQSAYELIPVVIMSAEASTAEIQACRQAGADGYMQKQMDFTDLTADLEALGRQWLAGTPRSDLNDSHSDPKASPLG